MTDYFNANQDAKYRSYDGGYDGYVSVFRYEYAVKVVGVGWLIDTYPPFLRTVSSFGEDVPPQIFDNPFDAERAAQKLRGEYVKFGLKAQSDAVTVMVRQVKESRYRWLEKTAETRGGGANV